MDKSNLQMKWDSTEPEKLFQMAFQDELTKLPNQFLYKDRLSIALANARRSKENISVCYINLIGFKNINERFGTKLGDQILVQIANRLASKIRTGDTLCRYEGDKFIILLLSVTKASLNKIVNRLKKVFEEPFYIEPYEINIKGRIGVCLGDPDKITEESITERAIYAEQFAKLMGYRDHIVELPLPLEGVLNNKDYFGPSMFQKGIEENEFVLHFQPQMDITQNKVIGLEALIRWNNPEYGFIYPGSFIEAAEKNGIIAPLGMWVIEKVFTDISILREKGYADCKVAINLSPLQLYQKDFIKELEELKNKYNVNPKYVEFEITEGVLIDNREEANQKLVEIHELGFQLAIDDFGTGFSSLEYLFLLENINLIKVDRSFVIDIDSNTRKRLILENIVKMIGDLEQSCLIEGVETIEQLTVLKELGVNFIQGNYYSKPISLEELIKWNGNESA